jgi:hypothetical protein
MKETRPITKTQQHEFNQDMFRSIRLLHCRLETAEHQIIVLQEQNEITNERMEKL